MKLLIELKDLHKINYLKYIVDSLPNIEQKELCGILIQDLMKSLDFNVAKSEVGNLVCDTCGTNYIKKQILIDGEYIPGYFCDCINDVLKYFESRQNV